jgi:DNA polymerase-3 subunit alpha
MDRLKGEFAAGGVKKGYDKGHCEELFDLIVKFAGYGFNKSHSAAYAMVTFYTSYLKCYYPTEYIASLLTLEKDNTDKVVKYVDEVKRMGFDLVPPDINHSYLVFSANKLDDQEVVMFGMGALKGAGDVAINSIINSRGDDSFKDLSDFVSRIDSSKVNKRVVETLIKSGAFDCFGYSRKAMLLQLEDIVEAAGKAALAKKMAVGSLFGDDDEMTTIEVSINNCEEYEDKEILEFEKASLGFYVSGHPLDSYRETLDGINYTLSSEFDTLADGSETLLIGRVETIAKKVSKKGFPFGIATIMDLHGSFELMLFEDRIKEIEEDFDKEKPIAFKVGVKIDDFGTKFNLKKIESLKEAKTEKLKKGKKVEKVLEPLHINIEFSNDDSIIYKIFDIISVNQGKRAMTLTIKSKLGDIELDSGYFVNNSVEAMLKELDGVAIR